MKPNLFLPCLLLLFGAGACQTTASTSRATSADDALLLEVSPAERSNIADARKFLDHASDAYAAAQADYAKAGEARTSAGRARDAAAAKVARAEVALTRATETGTTEAVVTARQDLQQAKAESQIEDARVTLSDKQTAYVGALATLAKEHVKVAEATVELTKAKAVNTLDRPASQKPDVSKFETSLRIAEAAENVARTRSEAAQKEVAIATATLKERESAGLKP